MSNIISTGYLFQFVIFVYVIPISITLESRLKFVFFNGLNLIRCSDDQIQVYTQPSSGYILFLPTVLKCENNKDILNQEYAGFKWNELKIICSSPTEAHEELLVEKALDDGHDLELPDVQGLLNQSPDPYELQIIYSAASFDIISSEDRPVDDKYFSTSIIPKQRRIYIWFQGHPIVCRIVFTGANDNPCPSMHDDPINGVDYKCYYNPGADEEPSIEEMEAEFKQMEAIPQPLADAYVLNLTRPSLAPFGPSSSNQTKKTKPQMKPISNKSQSGKKFPVLKILGIVLGILALILIIGGIAFYIIRKKNSNNAPSSSTSIEKGDTDDLSPTRVNKSQQSLSTTSANDADTEISVNVPSQEDKKNRLLGNIVFDEGMQ